MLGTTLRFDHEVRDDKPLFKDIPTQKVPKQMIDLAAHILDTKAGHFEPDKFKDAYELALRKLVSRKAAGKPIEVDEERETPSNVIDLMDALRRSVEGKGMKAAALAKSGDARKTSKTGKRRAASPRRRSSR